MDARWGCEVSTDQHEIYVPISLTLGERKTTVRILQS
jgi:hypothetical protein